VEEFYKEYAHEGGFSVRIGSQNVLFGEIVNKRFLCSRNGFKKKKEETGDPSKKRKSQVETRCGCDAHIYVKLGTDKKYHISSMVEQHNHVLCSPNKAPFLRSNRSVSQRAKNTLFTCHKASVGTSQSYRILQVTDGGFNHIGCMKWDL
jgi:zinc finger SWIM domain-containing protein 3